MPQSARVCAIAPFATSVCARSPTNRAATRSIGQHLSYARARPSSRRATTASPATLISGRAKISASTRRDGADRRRWSIPPASWPALRAHRPIDVTALTDTRACVFPRRLRAADGDTPSSPARSWSARLPSSTPRAPCRASRAQGRQGAGGGLLLTFARAARPRPAEWRASSSSRSAQEMASLMEHDRTVSSATEMERDGLIERRGRGESLAAARRPGRSCSLSAREFLRAPGPSPFGTFRSSP
jgi:hypothetical protein